MLSKENSSLPLSSMIEEITQSFTTVKADRHINVNASLKDNDQNGDSESVNLSLNHYSCLKKKKESFLEKCTKSYRKVIYTIGCVPSVLIGLNIFFIAHQNDKVDWALAHHQGLPLSIIMLEIMMFIVFAMIVFFPFALYESCSTLPRWFKKRWLKNRINEEQIFEDYKEKLYALFQNKEFQNNYFAHTRLQIAQLENQIEKTKIHDTSELKKILGKAIQYQTKLCTSFVESDAKEIHYEILDMENCFKEWKKLNQTEQPSDKVSDFLKQHEEFMKNSGLNNLLNEIREPDNANHVVKSML